MTTQREEKKLIGPHMSRSISEIHHWKEKGEGRKKMRGERRSGKRKRTRHIRGRGSRKEREKEWKRKEERGRRKRRREWKRKRK
jgi:hypothetical protein